MESWFEFGSQWAQWALEVTQWSFPVPESTPGKDETWSLACGIENCYGRTGYTVKLPPSPQARQEVNDNIVTWWDRNILVKHLKTLSYPPVSQSGVGSCHMTMNHHSRNQERAPNSLLYGLTRFRHKTYGCWAGDRILFHPFRKETQFTFMCETPVHTYAQSFLGLC